MINRTTRKIVMDATIVPTTRPVKVLCSMPAILPRREEGGNRDIDEVPTSFAERQNLTMRMKMRRFTRLTNAFSKKVENHVHAIALHFMHYNFVRRHMTLGMTPAQAAGVDRHMWSLKEVVDLIDRS